MVRRVTVVVDSLKYLTLLSLDALPYVLLEHLSNPLKSRVNKEDG